jgi:hypothetical protein
MIISTVSFTNLDHGREILSRFSLPKSMKHSVVVPKTFQSLSLYRENERERERVCVWSIDIFLTYDSNFKEKTERGHFVMQFCNNGVLCSQRTTHSHKKLEWAYFPPLKNQCILFLLGINQCFSTG